MIFELTFYEIYEREYDNDNSKIGHSIFAMTFTSTALAGPSKF